MMKRMLACTLTLLLLVVSGLAEAPTDTPAPALAAAIMDQTVPGRGGSVSYPQVTGIADAALAQRINDALLAAGQIEKRLNRMAALDEASEKLSVTYETTLAGDVLSVRFSAYGPLNDGRITHEWDTITLDLTTGETVPFSALFTEESAAAQALESYMEAQVAPELSGYLSACELTPLPESRYLTPEGITFCYTLETLPFLSGHAGSVTVLWSEIADQLDLAEGGILARLGVNDTLTLDEASAERIRASVAEGRLPSVPTVVGQSLQEAIDAWSMKIDPDYYTGGRYFQLEDGAFRGVLLMTDALTDGWEGSVVQGIRADRAELFGLITGKTTQAEWRAVLGEPDSSVTLDEDAAYGYILPAGTSDYYVCGAYRLRLHADESGTLTSLFITQ